MKKRIIFCCALVGFYVQAMPAQSEDLKAYYEKQKAELVQSFTAPASGTDITLVLLDGEEKTGVIRHLSENGIQILSDNALATFRKHELDKATCAKLFAEEYAHVEAIKRTRAYKRGASERARLNIHKGSLSVSSSIKRSSDMSSDSDERDGGTMEEEVKAYSRVQNLMVSVANRADHPDTYSLKWYFFVQKIGTDNVSIHSSGSEKIELEGREKVKRKIVSKEYSSKKVTKSWISCPKCSTSDTKVSGEEGEGYLVLLMCGDEIIDKEASSKRYLNEDWLKMCFY